MACLDGRIITQAENNLDLVDAELGGRKKSPDHILERPSAMQMRIDSGSDLDWYMVTIVSGERVVELFI